MENSPRTTIRFSLLALALVLTAGVPARARGGQPAADPVARDGLICGRRLLTGFGFDSETEAKSVLAYVINAGGQLDGYSGLSPERFDIRAASVPNALACEDDHSPRRYILYNPDWIKGLTVNAGTDWAKIAIIAHEVGHHARGHYLRGARSTPKLELEADDFAGKLLGQLKAPLDRALAAYSQRPMCNPEGSDTHPKCADRLAAVEKGWRETIRWKPGEPHARLAHIVAADKEGNWLPAPGYVWVNQSDPDPAKRWHVRWQPGRAHRTARNVVAADKEGSWLPSGGYVWVDINKANAGDLSVRWQPGSKHPTAAHVVAGAKERDWQPEAGYVWVDINKARAGDLSVRWRPGLKHPTAPHVIAGDAEGNWRPDTGYGWVDFNKAKAGDYSVRWLPNSRHYTAAHVFAAEKEGTWVPEAGYAWINPADKNDLTVSWKPGRPITGRPHVVACADEGKWCPESGYVWETPSDPKASNYAVRPAALPPDSAEARLARTIPARAFELAESHKLTRSFTFTGCVVTLQNSSWSETIPMRSVSEVSFSEYAQYPHRYWVAVKTQEYVIVQDWESQSIKDSKNNLAIMFFDDKTAAEQVRQDLLSLRDRCRP